MTTPLEDYLHHYASKYYDPVKAHEYYERNKQLKGRRRVTKGMNETQKMQWTYVKEQVNQEKKAVTEVARTDRKTETTKLRSDASAARKKITEAISAAIKRINERNISTEQKVRLKERERGSGNSERAELSENLKTTVGQAMEKYKAKAAEIKAKYETVLDTEYDKIRPGYLKR